ncbi:MAG: hypothetical protein ACRYHQ_07650, partial [Janthinobacterium lividum]
QDAFGGRKTTTKVICSDCNNRFGGSIDRKFSEQVSVVRNMLGLHSGSGDAPPIIRKIKTERGLFNIESNGEARRFQKPFSVELLEDGTKTLRINAKSFDDIKKHLPNMAAAIGVTEDEILERFTRTSFLSTETKPGTGTLELNFNETSVRAAAKACLVLWSTLTGNIETRSEPFRAVRQFVLEGSDDFLRLSAAFDARLIPNLAEIQEKYGTFFNMIHVCSSVDGKLIGHFTLYNLLAFSVTLASEGATANKSITLFSNPRNPSTWKVEICDPVAPCFEWLETPSCPTHLLQSRAAPVLEHHRNESGLRALNKIIDQIISDMGLDPDSILSKEQESELVNRLADRMARLVLDLPYTQEFDGNVIVSRLKE